MIASRWVVSGRMPLWLRLRAAYAVLPAWQSWHGNAGKPVMWTNPSHCRRSMSMLRRRSLTDPILDPAKVVIRKMTEADLEQVIAIDQVSFSLPWPSSSFKYELNQSQTSRCWVAEYPAGQPDARVIAMAVVWMIIDELHIA